MKRPLFAWAGLMVTVSMISQPLSPVFAAEPSSTGRLVADARLLGFDPNAVLSDSDIFGLGSMTRDDVQRFLSGKGALGTIQLKDIDGNDKSPADIIWRVATSYKINPKYLMVLLQKEQSLIEDPTPEAKQFDWATGYGVCDSCSKDDPSIQDFKGFANQLEWAAKQHREKYLLQLLGRGTTVAGHAPGKSVFIDGLSIVPANRATAMLYSYTPHINGNFNLWKIWQRWFSVSFPDGTVVQGKESKVTYLIRFGTKRPFASKSVASSLVDADKVVIATDSQLSAYPVGQPIKFPNYSLVETPAGTRFLIVNQSKRKIADMKTFQKFGFNEDEIVEATDDELAEYEVGPTINIETAHPMGLLVKDGEGTSWYVENNVRHKVPHKAFLGLYFRGKPAKAITKAKLETYTVGDPYPLRDGELVRTVESSAVYVIEHGMRRPITSGKAFEELGWKWSNVVTLPKAVLEPYTIGAAVDAHPLSSTQLANTGL